MSILTSNELRKLQNNVLYNNISDEDVSLLLSDCNFLKISSRTLSHLKSDWVYKDLSDTENRIILENLVLKLYKKTFIDPSNKRMVSVLFKLLMLNPFLIDFCLYKRKKMLQEKLEAFDDSLKTESILYVVCMAISNTTKPEHGDNMTEQLKKIIQMGIIDLLFDHNELSHESPLGLFRNRGLYFYVDFNSISQDLNTAYPWMSTIINSCRDLNGFLSIIKGMKPSDFVLLSVD